MNMNYNTEKQGVSLQGADLRTTPIFQDILNDFSAIQSRIAEATWNISKGIDRLCNDNTLAIPIAESSNDKVDHVIGFAEEAMSLIHRMQATIVRLESAECKLQQLV